MSTMLFQNETEQSAVQTIKETMKVFSSEDGTPMVSFATNKGKGSGAQVMAINQFSDYVEAVSHYAKNGVTDIPNDENLSPAESVHQTISLSDNIVTFRVRSGKGAKPAKIDSNEFSEVAELLTSTVAAVEAAGKRLTGSDTSDNEADDNQDDDNYNEEGDE